MYSVSNERTYNYDHHTSTVHEKDNRKSFRYRIENYYSALASSMKTSLPYHCRTIVLSSQV